MIESIIIGGCIFLILKEAIHQVTSDQETLVSNHSFFISPILTIVTMGVLIRDALLKMRRLKTN